MRTNISYINEYKYHDIFIESLLPEINDVEMAYKEFALQTKNIQASTLFESSSDRQFMLLEAEETMLAKIGKNFQSLIKKILDFVSSIANKIKESFGGIEKDETKVNKIISKNPSLKNEVVEGIKKEWFTYKDVAAYEKDIVGLVNMLNQKKIDNGTFVDKAGAALEKFNKSAKPFVAAGVTIGALAGIGPAILKNIKNCQDSLKGITKSAESVSKDASASKEADNYPVMYKIISQVSAEMTRETNNSANMLGRVQDAFNNFIGNHGDTDDTDNLDISTAKKTKDTIIAEIEDKYADDIADDASLKPKVEAYAKFALGVIHNDEKTEANKLKELKAKRVALFGRP